MESLKEEFEKIKNTEFAHKYVELKCSGLLCKSFTNFGNISDCSDILSFVSDLGAEFKDIAELLAHRFGFCSARMMFDDRKELGPFTYGMMHGYLLHEFESQYILSKALEDDEILENAREKLKENSSILILMNPILSIGCPYMKSTLKKMNNELKMGYGEIEHEDFNVQLIEEIIE